MFQQKKKGNNKNLRRSSLFSEVTGSRPLINFNFLMIPMLIKMRNIYFSGITRSGCFFSLFIYITYKRFAKRYISIIISICREHASSAVFHQELKSDIDHLIEWSDK